VKATRARAKTAARPVVFLHGLGGSSADWAAVLPFLPSRFRPFAPDLPGSSLQPGRFRTWTPDALAGWVEEVLRAEGISSPHVVGHSLGARVGGELATRDGQIASLLLVAPLGASGYSLTDRLKWKAMSRTAILRGVSEAQMRRALSYGFVKDGPGKDGFVERALAARTGPNSAAAAEAIERSVDGVLEARPLTERLRGTTLPVGIVAGGQDPLVPPEESSSLLAARKDARLFRLPTQGHYPMLDDPEGFASIVERFLDEADDPSA
jgi:pimeloyl-ACP methyl ester carboxylesterase